HRTGTEGKHHDSRRLPAGGACGRESPLIVFRISRYGVDAARRRLVPTFVNVAAGAVLSARYHIRNDLLRRTAKADGSRPGALRRAAQASEWTDPYRDRYGIFSDVRRGTPELRGDELLPALRSSAVARVEESGK